MTLFLLCLFSANTFQLVQLRSRECSEMFCGGCYYDLEAACREYCSRWLLFQSAFINLPSLSQRALLTPTTVCQTLARRPPVFPRRRCNHLSRWDTNIHICLPLVRLSLILWMLFTLRGQCCKRRHSQPRGIRRATSATCSHCTSARR